MSAGNVLPCDYDRDIRGALCFEHGYVGEGVKRLLDEWNSLMKTKAGRDKARTRLETCADLLKLDLDELAAWYAKYLAESRASRADRHD